MRFPSGSMRICWTRPPSGTSGSCSTPPVPNTVSMSPGQPEAGGRSGSGTVSSGTESGGPDAPARTAAPTSSRPPVATFPLNSGTASTDDSSARRTDATPASRATLHTNAAAPATCGAAIDVPLSTSVASPGHAAGSTQSTSMSSTAASAKASPAYT